MSERLAREIDIVSRLQEYGITLPLKYIKHIEDEIRFLKLDLSGLIVLTEAASRNFIYTPIIAALAGADLVYAITRDSSFGRFEEIKEATYLVAQLSGVTNRVKVVSQKSRTIVQRADIITNLGFVRPIDAHLVDMMKSTAVVPLMCEAWEYRLGDVDLAACKDKGILVLGTNENYPGMEVFNYCGWLCLKMLLDAHVLIGDCKFVILSGDKFGTTLEKFLTRLGVNVRLITDIKDDELIDADALIVADYSRNDQIIGLESRISPQLLSNIAPHITIIQFAGNIDADSLRNYGIFVYPGNNLPPHRMAWTLADLGAQPVIELHALGFKVGELGAHLRIEGLSGTALMSRIHEHNYLIQPLII